MWTVVMGFVDFMDLKLIRDSTQDFTTNIGSKESSIDIATQEEQTSDTKNVKPTYQIGIGLQ